MLASIALKKGFTEEQATVTDADLALKPCESKDYLNQANKGAGARGGAGTDLLAAAF